MSLWRRNRLSCRYDRGMHGNIHMLSYPEFRNYQAHNRVFTDMAAYADTVGSRSPAPSPRPSQACW
jgi:hypothetical protein